jgi:hypothetical protein
VRTAHMKLGPLRGFADELAKEGKKQKLYAAKVQQEIDFLRPYWCAR